MRAAPAPTPDPQPVDQVRQQLGDGGDGGVGVIEGLNPLFLLSLQVPPTAQKQETQQTRQKRSLRGDGGGGALIRSDEVARHLFSQSDLWEHQRRSGGGASPPPRLQVTRPANTLINGPTPHALLTLRSHHRCRRAPPVP